MTAVPLKSFQWCVAQVDFSLVSSHYLHNSGACVPNKLDYYAATPSFLRNPDLFTADPTLSKILCWNHSKNILYNYLFDCERIFYTGCSKIMSYSKFKLKSQKLKINWIFFYNNDFFKYYILITCIQQFLPLLLPLNFKLQLLNVHIYRLASLFHQWVH